METIPTTPNEKKKKKEKATWPKQNLGLLGPLLGRVLEVRWCWHNSIRRCLPQSKPTKVWSTIPLYPSEISLHYGTIHPQEQFSFVHEPVIVIKGVVIGWFWRWFPFFVHISAVVTFLNYYSHDESICPAVQSFVRLYWTYLCVYIINIRSKNENVKIFSEWFVVRIVVQDIRTGS